MKDESHLRLTRTRAWMAALLIRPLVFTMMIGGAVVVAQEQGGQGQLGASKTAPTREIRRDDPKVLAALGVKGEVDFVDTSLADTSQPPWRGKVAKARVERLRPVFGKIQQGLNLGLAVHGERRTFREGDWVALEYYIQNVGEETREVEFMPSSAVGRVHRLKNADGEPIAIAASMVSFEQQPIRITLQPNEIYGAVEGFQAGPRPDRRKLGPYWKNPRPGKYTVEFPLNVKVSARGHLEAGRPVQLLSGSVAMEYVDKPSPKPEG